MAKKTTSKPLPAAAPLDPAAPATSPAPSPAPPKRLIATARAASDGAGKTKSAPAARLPRVAPTKEIPAVAKAPAPAAKPAPISRRKASEPTAVSLAAAKKGKTLTATASPVKPAAARTARAKKSASPGFTHDDIAIRAYLIAENRNRHGIHAEPHEDWIEAERQLRAESSRSR